MTGTPDRFPGSRDETEVILRDQGADPTEAGASRYASGDFRMKDQYGVFNPRSGSGDGTLQRSINIAMTGDGVAKYQSVASNNWEVLGYMAFPGTVAWGTDGVDRVGFIGWLITYDANGIDLRLYDATNGNVIATVSAITATTPTVSATTSVSNLPSGPAVFEIQGKRNGNKNGACSIALLEKRFA